ncbi:MAG: OmpA family protein [Deltaproteobacteria bacterium]|nr:OmpA family protein [Deltaproteobacteria bacterium]
MRTFSLAFLLAISTVVGASACTNHATYVAADQAALGKVVVYRNGVAYYERKASVDGDKLAIEVPQDKIDDFLKSLTVTDAKTGLALPISFPSPGQAKNGKVEMTIQLPDKAHRDIVLSYVTESPAWKPTYRVVVSDTGKVDLQGWAIVDNTSGEDWKSVQVGVGSSSALSFRYDLHSIRLVHRETLHSQDNFAKAPPLGGSVHRDGRTEEMVLAAMDDTDLARPEGHPDVAGDVVAKASAEAASPAKTGGSLGAARQVPSSAMNKYRVARAAPPPGSQAKDEAAEDRKLAQLADQLKKAKRDVVIEGYAQAGESEAADKALDRANILRNQLIERGVAPAQVKAIARGVVAGQKAGVRVVAAPSATPEDGKRPSTNPDAPPVGESHFDSKTPMNVGKGTSAMVAIVHGQAQGEVVYLYDAESPNGDARFAFKSVRFKNPTGSTLESGPITVYGNGRFIGEGMADPIPPGATAVVPFALDRQVVVDREGSTGDRMSQLVKLNRGVMTAEVQHVRTTRLKVANRSHKATTVLVRHNTPKGWAISKGPKAVEQYAESRLFALDVPAGESRVLEIEESTPLVRTVDLRTPVGVDLVRVYLKTAKESPKIDAAMQRLLGLFDDMAKAESQIAHLRERGDEYRVRMDELHNQIFSLKAVKTGGTLMAHLQTKFKEMSERVQQTTIDIVGAQEKLMLARVKFQDELAELSLDNRDSKPAMAAMAK